MDTYNLHTKEKSCECLSGLNADDCFCRVSPCNSEIGEKASDKAKTTQYAWRLRVV